MVGGFLHCRALPAIHGVRKKKKESTWIAFVQLAAKRFLLALTAAGKMLHIDDGEFGDNGQRGGGRCKARRALEFNAFGEGI